MHLLAPAKINLHLRVGLPAAGGFHPLVSWMCTVSLFDTLTIESVDSPGIALSCDDPAMPCDASNLVARAANAIIASEGSRRRAAHSTGLPHRGLKIHLAKTIPSGAGLGGGSSDAGRTLLGLSRLWKLNLDRKTLTDIAANVGSDVPFFLSDGSSVCTGRGEVVVEVPRPAGMWALLVLPGIVMPTPKVYRRFDEMRLGKDLHQADEPDWETWVKLSAAELLPRLVNDLERPAFEIDPGLGALRARLEQTLSQPVRMSGSGSSLFTLYEDKEGARTAARQIGNIAARVEVVEVAPSFHDDAQ